MWNFKLFLMIFCPGASGDFLPLFQSHGRPYCECRSMYRLLATIIVRFHNLIKYISPPTFKIFKNLIFSKIKLGFNLIWFKWKQFNYYFFFSMIILSLCLGSINFKIHFFWKLIFGIKWNLLVFIWNFSDCSLESPFT